MDLMTLDVSSAKKKQFASRGINTVEDLLQFLPRAYKDFRYITGILPENQISIFRATVIDCRTIATSRIPMFTAACIEEISGQTVTVRWFHMNWFQREVRHLAESRAKVIIVGKVDYNPQFGFGLSQPEVFEPDSRALKIYPVYRAIPGMSSEYFNGKMSKALTIGVKDSEVLPAEVLKASGRIDMPTALTFLHAPKTMEEIELGRARILLNDLLYFAIHNELNKKEISAGSQFNIKSRHLVNKIIQSLPYRLTADQNAAVVDMMENAEAGRRIHALVCGDVGTGKTVICTLAAAGFIGSGYQAVIMAPTQVLAKQHFDSISKMLEPFGVKTVFLDSTLKKSERTVVLKEIREGSAQLIIGTNSCIGKDVIYKDLALTVVDEEHRFGVNQRAAIIEKAARGVHSITMSATPIPRSLAQVVYGDNVQLYTIRTRPEGRLPVKTRIFKNELGNMKFVLKEVRAGHQAYVVCPMIEQSEKSPELKSVDAVSQMYRETLEPYGVRIAELTGKTPKEEADGIIDRFKSGEIDVLIATTVIEVGVNVPNATVMIITNAERFGLSSLHQLRGRVGRSSLQSYCVLQSEDESEKGLSRLQVMCDTNDGFQIAEADLKQRGAGDLLGTQQSGDNKYVSLIIANPEIYREATGYARELINRGWDCCPLMTRIREERQGDLNEK